MVALFPIQIQSLMIKLLFQVTLNLSVVSSQVDDVGGAGAVVVTTGAGVEATGAGVEAVGAGVEAVGAGVDATGAGVEGIGAGVSDSSTQSAGKL